MDKKYYAKKLTDLIADYADMCEGLKEMSLCGNASDKFIAQIKRQVTVGVIAQILLAIKDPETEEGVDHD